MTSLGDIYRKELENARIAASLGMKKLPKKQLHEPEHAVEDLIGIVEELRAAGAQVAVADVVRDPLGDYTLTLIVVDTDYPVVVSGATIKIYWRGGDRLPTLYGAATRSRLAALAKAIIERAVSRTIALENVATSPEPQVRLVQLR